MFYTDILQVWFPQVGPTAELTEIIEVGMGWKTQLPERAVHVDGGTSPRVKHAQTPGARTLIGMKGNL
jgi:hypothetical protein